MKIAKFSEFFYFAIFIHHSKILEEAKILSKFHP